jgi:DNA repair exonuclease SbcCD ATPase subunit
MQDTIEMHERVSSLEQAQKSTNRRLDNLEKLVESVHVIATEMKAMRQDVNDTIDRVDEIEHRPQKRYDTIITAVITSVIGVIIGYFLK